MKLLKKTAAGLLLSWGFICSLIVLSVVFTPGSERTEDDNDAALGGLAMGVPSLAVGGWIVAGMRRQAKLERDRQAREREKQIGQVFYRVLQENDGRISPLLLSMAAEISGEEAKQFLDAKAVQFDGEFDVSDRGDIFYRFPTLS